MCKSVDTDQWKSAVYLYKGMLFNGEMEQATDMLHQWVSNTRFDVKKKTDTETTDKKLFIQNVQKEYKRESRLAVAWSWEWE